MEDLRWYPLAGIHGWDGVNNSPFELSVLEALGVFLKKGFRLSLG